MNQFKIQWKKSAVKDLQSIPQGIVGKIFSVVDTLKDNPTPQNAVKLTGTKNYYRIRISDYRIIYSLTRKELTIHIVKIGHRKEIYKRK